MEKTTRRESKRGNKYLLLNEEGYTTCSQWRSQDFFPRGAQSGDTYGEFGREGEECNIVSVIWAKSIFFFRKEGYRRPEVVWNDAIFF